MTSVGEGAGASPAELAEALRTEFDEAFSRPVRDEAVRTERLVLIGVGAERYAVRLRELGGLLSLPVLTELPGRVPHRLGICAVRGRLVAFFDLASVLGIDGSGRAARIGLLRGDEAVGLACHELAGLMAVPSDEIRPAGPGTGSFTDAMAETDGERVPVLSLRRVVESVGTVSGDGREH